MKIRSIVACLLCLLLTVGTVGAVEVETVSVTKETETANLAPIAENLELRTYRETSVGGTLQAVDPEGDAMTFRLCEEPKKGTLILKGANFVYTPDPKKKGKDSFTYTAADSHGNVSAEAKVTVSIEKQSGKICYADLEGDPLAYAALRLAEENVFAGEKVGCSWCFSPDRDVTRGEFLTMCASMTGMQPLDGVTRTGFYDDEGIALWLKPYVSAALMCGVVQGSAGDSGRIVFDPERTITAAEAAVMLNSFLLITDSTSISASENVPVWAAKAVGNLSACDIYPSGLRAERSMTRRDAAAMLSAAMDACSDRSRSIRSIWAE